MEEECVQLTVGQTAVSFVFLRSTPALQHSLQELSECRLVHILSAASEETNYLDQSVPAHFGTSCSLHMFVIGGFDSRLCRSYWRPSAAQSSGLTQLL